VLGISAKQRAYWVSSTIAWGAAERSGSILIPLHYAPEGGLLLPAAGITGGSIITLEHDPAGLPDV
jgi:hypothetical protein